MNIEDVKKLNIPKTPGCYKFYRNKTIIYIGKTANLKNRVFSYWQKGADLSPAKKKMLKQIDKVEWVETDSEIGALLLESNLIKKHQPAFNIIMRDDKRYAYIKISTDDEIPGVFVTRQVDKSGKYFGPFTSVRPARETLKAIRVIWPYCTERKVKNKPCFYYQINRCTGVCGAYYDINKYKNKIINPIILFLSGKKQQVVASLEKQLAGLNKQISHSRPESDEFRDIKQEIDIIKIQLLNIKNVLEHANIISVGEKYAADVVELAKTLKLSSIPQRIEGYDISNIFGQEAVGSMVVFASGEPAKQHYRKFKIKIGQGKANDTQMLKEVIARRIKHITKAEEAGWKKPDLIIIDGGKDQLNAVNSILEKAGMDIPLLAVSKGQGIRSAQAPDKIFFPGERNALELPLASPALHIIKRVRDEAHRFAIKYHQALRRKKLLNS